MAQDSDSHRPAQVKVNRKGTFAKNTPLILDEEAYQLGRVNHSELFMAKGVNHILVAARQKPGRTFSEIVRHAEQQTPTVPTGTLKRRLTDLRNKGIIVEAEVLPKGKESVSRVIEQRKEHYSYLRDEFFGPLAKVPWLHDSVQSLFSVDAHPLPFSLDLAVQDLISRPVFNFGKGHLKKETSELLSSLPRLVISYQAAYWRCFQTKHPVDHDGTKDPERSPLERIVRDALEKPSIGVPVMPSLSVLNSATTPCVLVEGFLNWIRWHMEEAIERTAKGKAPSDSSIVTAEPVGIDEPENPNRIYSDRRDVLAIHTDGLRRSSLAKELTKRGRDIMESASDSLAKLGERAKNLRDRCDAAQVEVAKVLEELKAGTYHGQCACCPSRVVPGPLNTAIDPFGVATNSPAA